MDEQTLKLVSYALAIICAALGGNSWLKRIRSKDGVIVASDASERSMLKVAMEEADTQRKRADEAYHERNVAMQELGKLRAQVASLEEHRVNCDRRIEQAEKHCDQRIEEMERQLVILRAVVERRLAPRE